MASLYLTIHNVKASIVGHPNGGMAVKDAVLHECTTAAFVLEWRYWNGDPNDRTTGRIGVILGRKTGPALGRNRR